MSENGNDVPQDVQEFAARLFNYARTGDMQLVEYVDQGVNVNLTNQDGNTFVMLASYSGQPELVKALIERGAEVNQPNGRGQTPLGGVIFKKEDAIIDLLLEAGADPHAGHPSGVEAAQMFGREDLLEKFNK
ncbi:ankyrin repeat domain-containing protein [Corynebacterium breve]|uniref:Ankyrin repeat domain-containing protein n=1 Tax=Corynebacterium breve TaxID=3049799 RepID=A0ABY8VBX5_9CORY|nr:ankyrin repeat domain-containing protein [Corynebacterium breve]WIM67141.1 ankyrin repeat domain-containing protein [Corynebacterium breve]